MPTTPSPPRFEMHRPMLLAGLRRVYSYAESMREIPREWARFEALLPLPGQVGEVTYGAMCSTDPAAQTFEYMCAVEVADLAAQPAGIGKMRVPEAWYAVFTHPGPVATIRETWDWIWQAWYPACGFEMGQTPDFERYGPGFDPATGTGRIEIWFPLQPR